MLNNGKAELFSNILSGNLYACLATTTKDGDPWISQVYFVADKSNSFYWYSSVKTRHSKLIAENNKIALSIYNSTAVGDDVSAVYIKAHCGVVTEKKTIVSVLQLYASKMLKTGFVTSLKNAARFVKNYQDFLGDSELRLYKATPYELSMLAESRMYHGKYIDSRINITTA